MLNETKMNFLNMENDLSDKDHEIHEKVSLSVHHEKLTLIQIVNYSF